jgi:glutamate-1-semialdehyde aminotransferase
MVKFTRTGGEASAVAIRIARAASGRDKIATCGYHGWHDWYLSANLNNSKNLSSHLMPNVPIRGVNKILKNSIFSFEYNNFKQLENIITNHEIGAVIMEVERNHVPKDYFLNKIRNITRDKKIVLIFDECTSGFRKTFGGLHLHYNIEPDIVLFGKALGNGYAINAIVGKESIMKYANSSFISSTFWTERIGYAAALETLKVMNKLKSWNVISQKGKKIKNEWQKLSAKYSLNLNIEGLDALPRFEFTHDDHQYFKTYISQEFLKKGILATNSIYLSVVHDDLLVNRYLDILETIFKKISLSIKEKNNIHTPLDGPVCLSGLRSKGIGN